MKMNKAVQIRMPVEMWDHLSNLAAKRAPGTKVTHLIREAIQRSFFADPDEAPATTYRLQEVTALRADEASKKSHRS
jgi:hypothetical protein